jgi:hypothetical protein
MLKINSCNLLFLLILVIWRNFLREGDHRFRKSKISYYGTVVTKIFYIALEKNEKFFSVRSKKDRKRGKKRNSLLVKISAKATRVSSNSYDTAHRDNPSFFNSEKNNKSDTFVLTKVVSYGISPMQVGGIFY